MTPKNLEPSRPGFSHWPWHGWVDDPCLTVPNQLLEKECQAFLLEREHMVDDREWEKLVLRLR